MKAVTVLAGGWMAATLAAAGAATTGEVLRLTVDDAVRMGVERAVPVQNARRDTSAADARVGETRAIVLPDVKARGGWTHQGELQTVDLGEGEFALGRQDTYSAAGEVSQLLFDGGSAQAALRAASLYRERAAWALRQAEAVRARDVRVAFRDAQLAAEALSVVEQSVAQLRKFAEEAEQRFRQEAASEFDLRSARVRVANETPRLIEARRGLQVARAQLRNLLSIDHDRFELEGRLEYRPLAADLEQAVRFARECRPEIQQMRRSVGLNECDLRYERGGYWPALRARAAYNGQDPEHFFSAEDSWYWWWEAGVTVEWSLFDGARRVYRVRQKALELEKSRADLADAARAVALEVEQAWLAMQEAAAAVEASRETVALAEKNLEIADVRYRQGLSTYLEFTDTNLALSTARLQWNRALHAHLTAKARLAYACGVAPGRKLEEDLRHD